MIIYSSSAGSGKTFALVKEYIKIALNENDPSFVIPHILAITFTNNATNEMKERIILYLKEIAKNKKDSAIFNVIIKETDIPENEIIERSYKTVDYILSDYHDFSVMTIDSFLQKMLKAFAVELDIPYNYELILNEEDALKICIEELIDEYGRNENISDTIMRIALEEMAKGKSWRIEKTLMKSIPPIFMRVAYEYDIENMDFVKGEWLEDFYKKINMLKTQAEEIVDESEKYKKHIKKYNYVLNRIKQIKSGDYNLKFTSNWDKIIAIGIQELLNKKYGKEAEKFVNEKLYPYIKKVDSILRNKNTEKMKFLIRWYYFYKLIAYLKEKTEKYRLNHKSVFMKEITKRIKDLFEDDIVPFIYYKIGTRFYHYLIDEFQDTARDQWDAILPLIEEAESIGGTVITVGDVKQAIYRWRDGDKEIMKGLEGERINLDTNYRSLDRIVEFNNIFFEKLKEIKNWDADNIVQNTLENNKGGYVEINNVVNAKDYVSEIIDDLINRGYSYSDIAVLIRNNNDAKEIIDLFIKRNIPFTSPDTLVIGNNIAVEFTIDILNLFVTKDKTLIGKILSYIDMENKYDRETNINDIFDAFNEYKEDMGDKLKDIYHNRQKLGFYELVSFIAEISGNIFENNDVYLYRLLDYIDGIKDVSITAFLEEWDDIKRKIQIKGTGGDNAVSIMTIHKSKGLGFPVVIIPYASWELKSNSGTYIVRMNFNDEEIVVNTTLSRKSPIDEIRNEIAKINDDEYNLLYVAFTRAKEELYVLCQNKGSSDEKWKGMSNEIMDVLRELEYKELPIMIGEKGIKKQDDKSNDEEDEYAIKLFVYDWSDRMVIRKDIFFTTEEIDIGDCLHYALYLTDDYEKGMDERKWDMVFKKYPIENKEEVKKYYKNIIESLKKTVNTKDFCSMKEISFVHKGKKGRMDVLFVKDKDAVVCDYKTGRKRKEDINQVKWYMESLENMGYENVKGYVIYANGDVVKC